MLGRSSLGGAPGQLRGRRPAPAPPGEVLGAGVGDTQVQGGQLYMSTLPNNLFQPEAYGWEAYGDEP